MSICINFDAISALTAKQDLQHAPGQIPQDASQPLSQKTLILTPNSRTQQALITGAMQKLAAGEVATDLSIQSFSQWQQHLWQTLSFLRPLPELVANLELKIWLKQLIQQEPHWQLTNALGVAEKVLEALRNLTAWNKAVSDLVQRETSETPETKYFIQWAKQLNAFCDERKLLPQFAKLPFLQSHLKEISEQIPGRILLVGFNQLVPSEESFLDECRALGCSIEFYYPKVSCEQARRIEVDELAQEIEVAAAYAFEQSQINPHCRIGIVVNQLSSQLALVHEAFSTYFHPEEARPWQSLERTKYNVSAGQPLLEQPMIDAAVKIIGLRSSKIEPLTLMFLKNTPFIDWGEQAEASRYFLHQQYSRGFPIYSVESLLKAICRQPQPEKLSLLQSRLKSLKSQQHNARIMSSWSQFWRGKLTTWGWIEGRKLDETESVIAQEFNQVFADFLELTRLCEIPSAAQANEFFMQVLTQKTFQLPSDRTNVHVLGVLEASGLEFDQLFLVGFSQENWPQKAKSNPFLPRDLQQQWNMPGCSAEREFEYARDLSQSLLSAAKKIWVTECRSDPAEPSNISGFFSEIKHYSEPSPVRENHSQESPSQENQLPVKLIGKPTLNPDYHWWKDEKIALSAKEISGGAYLFGLFSSCPFKAMSKTQLAIEAPASVSRGIPAKIRGIWLHDALEFFWQETKQQATLLAMTLEQLEQRVEHHLSRAKEAVAEVLNAVAAKELVELEQEKLKGQILSWLELERERSPFSVKPELPKQVTLNGLTVSLRIDRVDEDKDSNLSIIDYKTGNADVKKWLGDRPEEAQMPLYALACEPANIKSLSYAKIKTGEIAREGFWFDHGDESAGSQSASVGFRYLEKSKSRDKDKTRSLSANSHLLDPAQSLTAQWRKVLTRLARNILAGEMPVSPKHPVDSCRYCDYADFCRVNESQPSASERRTAEGAPESNPVAEQKEKYNV